MTNTVRSQFSLGLAALLGLFHLTGADTDYGVYFDVQRAADGSKVPNPWGAPDYDPKAPQDWDRVDADAYPIFVDWGKKLDNPYWWDKGNMCEDRSYADYTQRHRQSPIILTDDEDCDHRHKMFNLHRGVCDKEQLDFYTTPYGLSAEFNSCTEVPIIDHSLNDDPWQLVHIVVKVPAEHKVDIYGTEEEFDAEIQLYYKGTRDADDFDLDGHAENIAVTSVLVRASGDQDDDELEKYIKGWEAYQEDQYSLCDVEFHDDHCSLKDSGKEYPYEECSLCFDYGCCTDRRLSGFEASMRGASSPQAGRDPYQVIEKQRKEIEGLKEALSACAPDTQQHRQRELGQWDKKCPDSYYCPINLYKHTESDFYYAYKGSLTVPPCTEHVHWRVMINPLFISHGQLERLEELTYKHLEYPECKLNTVGKLRGDGCKVDVNRPIQNLSYKHELKQCDAWAESLYHEIPIEEEEDKEEGDEIIKEDEEKKKVKAAPKEKADAKEAPKKKKKKISVVGVGGN